MGTNFMILLVFGVLVGVFSGLMGLGGGAIMIPVMVLLMGLTQVKAQALSLLVMIPPVMLPAVIKYWQEGRLDRRDIWTALLIAAGFAAGSYFGAALANWIDRQHQHALRLVFGFVLIYVAGYTVFSWFGRAHLLRTVILAGLLVAVTGIFFVITSWIDGRAERPQDPENSIVET
jgi:uncharacterized membrane protein YfcA